MEAISQAGSAVGILAQTAGAQTFTATSGTLAGSPVSFPATATAGQGSIYSSVRSWSVVPNDRLPT